MIRKDENPMMARVKQLEAENANLKRRLSKHEPVQKMWTIRRIIWEEYDVEADTREEARKIVESRLKSKRTSTKPSRKTVESLTCFPTEPRGECIGCGCKSDLFFGPCPYNSDVNADYTPVWLCSVCRLINP